MKQVMEPENRPQRRSPLAMKCTVNRANLKPNAGTSVYIAVDLTPSAAVIAGRVRSISLAIDSSGSMDGEKMDQAKAAALALIKQLRPTDQISIVSFSDAVTVQLPMTQVGNGRQRAAAREDCRVRRRAVAPHRGCESQSPPDLPGPGRSDGGHRRFESRVEGLDHARVGAGRCLYRQARPEPTASTALRRSRLHGPPTRPDRG